MNPAHKVVAIGQESAVHAELAEVRWKCDQMKKAYRRERWIHIGINTALSIALTVMLFIHYG